MRKLHFRLLALASMLSMPLISRADDRVYSISDREEASADSAPAETASAESASQELVCEYPRQVSHAPGRPRKPLWDRPGDIDRSNRPPERYCQDDCFRAGWPHSVRKWATGSTNSHYSAWYVGGGSATVFPHGRGPTCEEGTWGLDYSLWPRPGHVWMKWTHGREQGGLGAYETDR